MGKLLSQDSPLAPSLVRQLQQAQRWVAITGAGVSAESGIPTFRGAGGYWREHRAEDLASPQGFSRNPALVWEWYSERRQTIQSHQPNPAHSTLALLEQQVPDFCLITQNVDGYHRQAGSQHVLEVHGNIWKVRCTVEQDKLWEDFTIPTRFPVYCSCGALARPHIVWFGESYDSSLLQQAVTAVSQAQVILVIGTSGMVAISSALLAQAPQALKMELNLAASEVTDEVDYCLTGPAGESLPWLWQQIKSVSRE